MLLTNNIKNSIISLIKVIVRALYEDSYRFFWHDGI